MKPWIVGLALAAALSGPVAAESDGAVLRAHLQETYPSLTYVERYRRDYPEEVQGTDALWSSGSAPDLTTASDLVKTLVGLEDQHVAIVGTKAGKTETLGVMFRTSTDGAMVVWRVFDSAVSTVRPTDVVLSIDGIPTAAWLKRAQAITFGGNRRSREAEAALNLGLGTRVVHETQGVGAAVTLEVVSANGAPREVVLVYRPMSEDLAAAMNVAVNERDLPKTFSAAGRRVATMRLGAFAPQYDPAFNAASDEAAKIPGASDDEAMVAGFCAIVRNFIAEYDAVGEGADVMVLDLRGNMGGFGREARLLAEAMAPAPPPRTFDVFASGEVGVLKLVEQPYDPSCGHVKSKAPIFVLTDAGTRSAGELLAAWMWAAGATVAGERTIGAGGGFEAGSPGFSVPGTGYNIRTSGNFTFFDPTAAALKAGAMDETALVDVVSADRFAPSHKRPFAIQAAGLRPDLRSDSTLSDLRDGGIAQVGRIVAGLRAQNSNGR